MASTRPPMVFPSALSPSSLLLGLSTVCSHRVPRRLLSADAPVVRTSFTGAWCTASTWQFLPGGQGPEALPAPPPHVARTTLPSFCPSPTLDCGLAGAGVPQCLAQLWCIASAQRMLADGRQGSPTPLLDSTLQSIDLHFSLHPPHPA